MKIIKKEDKYFKVSDDMEADMKVRKLGYTYVSRSEYKTNVRDLKKAEMEIKAEEVAEKKKNKRKNGKYSITS